MGKKELITELVQTARAFRLCGPSDDPDEQTSVTSGYFYLVTQFKRLAGPILSEEAAGRLNGINVEINNIYSVYEARAELDALLPDIEEALQKLDHVAADTLPATLAQIPNKNILISDLQRTLDVGDLVAVLYMDLDGFKAVNDKLNHAKGDECLIRVARIMSESLLGKGKLYRPGGDEFVAVLPNFNSTEAAGTAERIRAAIDRANPGDSLKMTVSIGVASSEWWDTKADDLITRADDALMHKAKKMKNCVAVGDPARNATSKAADE